MSASSVSPLEAHLGYWLRRVSNEVSGAFLRALKEEGISAAEWVALRLLLGESERSSADLVALTGMTRGAISKVLDKLEGKELVARTANPGDGRVHWLSLTRKGERLVPKLATLADGNDARFFDCLQAKERAELRRLLEKLAAAHGLHGAPVD